MAFSTVSLPLIFQSGSRKWAVWEGARAITAEDSSLKNPHGYATQNLEKCCQLQKLTLRTSICPETYWVNIPAGPPALPLALPRSNPSPFRSPLQCFLTTTAPHPRRPPLAATTTAFHFSQADLQFQIQSNSFWREVEYLYSNVVIST